MLGSRVGFSGSAELMVQLSKFKNPRWRLTAMLDIQNGHNFATSLTIDVMFGNAGFRLSLDFFPIRGLHTRTAVARNPRVSYRLSCFNCSL